MLKILCLKFLSRGVSSTQVTPMKSETSPTNEGLALKFKRLRYQKWFAANYSDDNGLIPFTSALHKRDQIRTIAQFRMGSHWLNTERKRLVDGIHIPRSMRHCQLCGFQKPEDEMHMFECPFYNDIRLRYQKLFTYIYIDMHMRTLTLLFGTSSSVIPPSDLL